MQYSAKLIKQKHEVSCLKCQQGKLLNWGVEVFRSFLKQVEPYE